MGPYQTKLTQTKSNWSREQFLRLRADIRESSITDHLAIVFIKTSMDRENRDG